MYKNNNWQAERKLIKFLHVNADGLFSACFFCFDIHFDAIDYFYLLLILLVYFVYVFMLLRQSLGVRSRRDNLILLF